MLIDMVKARAELVVSLDRCKYQLALLVDSTRKVAGLQVLLFSLIFLSEIIIRTLFFDGDWNALTLQALSLNRVLCSLHVKVVMLRFISHLVEEVVADLEVFWLSLLCLAFRKSFYLLQITCQSSGSCDGGEGVECLPCIS